MPSTLPISLTIVARYFALATTSLLFLYSSELDLESHIQTQVWLQVWNLKKKINWLSQDYLLLYLDLCQQLGILDYQVQ